MKKAVVLAFGVSFLVGCATTVTPPQQALKAPSDRVFKFQDAGEKQAITVIRDSGFIGGGCYASVYIDGELSAKLNPKEKARFFLPKGEHAVGATLEGRGLCGFNGERQERYITLNEQQDKYVRVFTDKNGSFDIRPTTLYQ